MNNQQNSFILTIQKIFNWNNEPTSHKFDLSIYSLKTSSLIIHRRISGFEQKNQMILNYSLKISYFSDENQILIKLSNIKDENSSTLGQFIVNLDHLFKKKVSILKFPEGDKMLKVMAVDGQIISGKTESFRHDVKQSRNKNEQFIRQRQDFLKRVKVSNEKHSSISSRRDKVSLSQKAKNLLSQVQALKSKKTKVRDIQQQFNDYYTNDFYRNDQKDKKETHNYKDLRDRPNYHLQLNKMRDSIRDSQSNSRFSNHSQKHKLKLKNLQLQPCQNEYYQQPMADRKLQRKSQMILPNHFNNDLKKRIYKSPVY